MRYASPQEQSAPVTAHNGERQSHRRTVHKGTIRRGIVFSVRRASSSMGAGASVPQDQASAFKLCRGTFTATTPSRVGAIRSCLRHVWSFARHLSPISPRCRVPTVRYLTFSSRLAVLLGCCCRAMQLDALSTTDKQLLVTKLEVCARARVHV